jgi:dipeptidyl aminopeptidase/acylaminoacyl peptidase
MHKSQMLIVILLAVLVLVGCGGDGDSAQDPPSASRPAADLQVTSQREFKDKSMQAISLSPDGQWLLAVQRGVPCMYETASLDLKFCVEEPEINALDYQSVAWSPDGGRVALTENFFRQFFDSDLWVLDIKSAKLTNLTEDHAERIPLGADQDEKPLIDLLPTWSPNGKELLFTRSIQRTGTVLYRISASGGKAERLQTIDVEMPGVVWPGMHWSADGKQIFYTLYKHDFDDPDNGVWVAEKDGKNPRQLVATDAEMGPPLLMEVSAQGDKALVFYAQAAGKYIATFNACYYFLLDLETGKLSPIKQASGEKPEFSGLQTAVFSPDGSKILYTYRAFEGEFRLVARDVEGGPENVLVSSEERLGFAAEIGLGLNWARDDTIYVGIAPVSSLLISLGTE